MYLVGFREELAQLKQHFRAIILHLLSLMAAAYSFFYFNCGSAEI